MHLPLLPDIVIILGASMLIVLLFQKLKLPAILGFLLTGILVGPHGLNLIEAIEEVELLSEIGIIFLLFVIGIEFSLKGLSSIKRTVFIGGGIQVSLTIALVCLASYYLLNLSLESSIFMGFLLSLSSTAIVLKMLQENGEISSPHGRVTVAILIFQDLVVVVMMLLTPILAGQTANPLNTLLLLLVKVVGVVVFIILLAKYIVPLLYRLVVKTKSKELFILTTVVICFATAWLTSSVGLSLALGAFFAGLVISESEYSHQANANILPFREIFISFFFVSVGMLLNLEFFVKHLLIIHLAALGILILKSIIVVIAVMVLRYPIKTVLLSALSIFQVGEFAFLLSASGMEYNLLSEETYQYFLSISIITMGATPFVINLAPRLVKNILLTPLPKKVKTRLSGMAKEKSLSEADIKEACHDHIVIIGYGLNGENVAKAAKQIGLDYVIIELDPTRIAKGKAENHPIIYGDATDDEILRHVNIHEARVVVIAISEIADTKKVISTVRLFTETVHLIVRTRYIRQIEELITLGADEVIPEEFETSIEIFTRVLKEYLIPLDKIDAFVSEIRSHNYEMLRGLPGIKSKLKKHNNITIPDMEIATLPVQQGKNKVVGKSIGESELRSNFGVTVLAIKRNDEYLTDINEENKILADDILYVFGKHDDIYKLNKHFQFN